MTTLNLGSLKLLGLLTCTNKVVGAETPVGKDVVEDAALEVVDPLEMEGLLEAATGKETAEGADATTMTLAYLMKFGIFYLIVSKKF